MKTTHRLNTGGNVYLYVCMSSGGRVWAWSEDYDVREVDINNEGLFTFEGSEFNLAEFEEL